MSLTLGNIEPDTIRLIGYWHTKKMIHYLHITVHPFVQEHVVTMVPAGDYTLISEATLIPVTAY